MATTKLYLDTRAVVGDKPAPLKISITKQGRTAYLPLNVKILPSQWDRTKCRVLNHPQRQMMNNYIAKRLIDVNELLSGLEEQGSLAGLNATEVKDVLSARINGSSGKDSSGDRFLARLKKYGNSRVKKRTRELYAATASRIEAFSSAASALRFEHITVEWLLAFDTFLARTSPARNARNIHFRNIRAVFNEAIDDGVTEFYPFRKFKITPEPTRSRAYSVDTLRRLFDYPVEPWQQKYVDLFKLIFALIGINAVDLYNVTGLDGDRLNYTRSKTSRAYSIKVEPEAMEIIARHRGRYKLLAEAESCRSSKIFLQLINRGLQSIGTARRVRRKVKGTWHNVLVRESAFSGITTYVARHSWATIAAELDIPKETIAAALGHGGNTVTDIYISYDRKKIDEANRRVLDWVFYGKK